MRFMNRPRVIVASLVLLLSAGRLFASPVSVEVSMTDDVIEIGKSMVLEITVTPAAGQTILPDQVDIKVTTPDSDPFFGTPYPLRRLQPTGADAPVRFEWAAPVNEDQLPGQIPVLVHVSVPLTDGTTGIGDWRQDITVDFGEEWSADKIANYLDRRGLPLFLLVVFGFGLLMSLSPCIYPMIPITLAVIGAQSQDKGAVHGLIMSITYVVGMAIVYAVLGALSATVFSGITAFMQSPAILVPIALLLFGLSFSMFGAFELQAPAFLRDRLQGPGGGKTNLVGVFAMGLVAGLVASPCVGPFLAALLVWVATTGNWVLGFFTLFTFGMGMGMLLIGVGTFPALWGSMPSSGGWMDTIKKAMGLLLVAMAYYFVRPGSVLPANIFYPLVGVTSILVAVFMGAFDSLSADSDWWSRTSKGLGLAVFTAGIYLLFGSFLQYGFLIPSPLGKQAAGPHTAVVETAAVDTTPSAVAGAGSAIPAQLPAKVDWTRIHTGENVQAFLTSQRAEAKLAGKPIVIDFWASWCVYCKKLDKLVWKDPAVAAESRRFVTLKVDATAPDDAEMEKIKEEFKVPGLPRVVFIDSRGEVLHGQSVGFLKAAEMLAVMKSIR